MRNYDMEIFVDNIKKDLKFYRTEYIKAWNAHVHGDYTVDVQKVVAILDFLDEIDIALERSYKNLLDYQK